MKKRDQKRRRRPRPYKRKIHFPDGDVWSYRFGNSIVAIRTPDNETTHQIPLSEIAGMLWDDMERGQWKGWWTGVGPQRVKNYISWHLRPGPYFDVPEIVFMPPRFGDWWHIYEDCRFLPHRKTGQTCDPARVSEDDLEERLGEEPTRLNLCGVCMQRHQEPLTCMDCRDPEPEYYMVWDELWRKAVPDKKGQLCFSCLGKRIGRPLRQSDFPPHIPLNQIHADDIRRLAP